MTILACTGGSRYGDAAVRLAGRLATGMGAAVTVLSVRDPHDRIDTGAAIARAAKILERMGASHTTKIRTGHPAQQILEESCRGHDSVVLGSHGTHGVVDFFWATPPPRWSSTCASRCWSCAAPGRLLVCLRLGRDTRDLLAAAGRLARALGARITLLNVVPLPTTYGPAVHRGQDPAARRPEEWRYLRAAADELRRGHGIESELRIREGVPEEEILREALESAHALIIVGASSWRGLSGLLLGNFSYTILKHAKTSVLVLMPPSGEPQRP